MNAEDLKYPVKGEHVVITGEAYTGLQGTPATVTDDSPHNYRVDVGGFEVIIRHPAEELEVQVMQVGEVLLALDKFRQTLPAGSFFEVKPSGTTVIQLSEQAFRRAFADFEYSISRYGSLPHHVSIRLIKVVDGVEFWTLASRDCLAEAEAWIAAQETAEEVQETA